MKLPSGRRSRQPFQEEPTMDDLAQSKIEVIVTVAEDRKANLKQIASELQIRGLELTAEPLEDLGMITGKALEMNLDQLKIVSGVTAVEKAGTVHIAPPESEVQ
jgi:hypothetical protein